MKKTRSGYNLNSMEYGKPYPYPYEKYDTLGRCVTYANRNFEGSFSIKTRFKKSGEKYFTVTRFTA